MKIVFLGLELSEGKVKYKDPRLYKLQEKLSPKKVSPLFVEFTREKFETADIIICAKDKFLDISIIDMDRLESRLKACAAEAEKKLFESCIKFLEQGEPLSDMNLSLENLKFLSNLNLLSLRPVLICPESCADINELIKKSLEKAGVIFFYTQAKGELKSWPIKKGAAVIEAAGKIHSDLARGFIKAEVVNFSDFMNVHNLAEAKTKGLLKLVDKDYIVQDGDLIEIKFNV